MQQRGKQRKTHVRDSAACMRFIIALLFFVVMRGADCVLRAGLMLGPSLASGRSVMCCRANGAVEEVMEPAGGQC